MPSREITCRIYGAQKIHKNGVLLRTIVNTIGSPTYQSAKFEAKSLLTLFGHTYSYIKGLKYFFQLIKEERINLDDIIISFGVVFIFTKNNVEEEILVVKEIVNLLIGRLVEVFLRSTFFSFREELYEQMSGVVMGSCLSLVMANFYMENFESNALNTYHLKHKVWKRFVDDTNVIWPHGKEELTKFLHHLDNISKDIQFTMEEEESNYIPFLDILIIKKPNGRLDLSKENMH